MSTRRIAMAALCGAVMSALTIAPVAAAGPKAPADDVPLTAEQRAASDRKVAAANAYLAGIAASGVDLVSLQCVTPTSVADGPGTRACTVPQAYLPVEARDQVNGIYCGPAVGQVIANYSWAVAPGGNKFTQTEDRRLDGRPTSTVGRAPRTLPTGWRPPRAVRRAGRPSGSGW